METYRYNMAISGSLIRDDSLLIRDRASVSSMARLISMHAQKHESLTVQNRPHLKRRLYHASQRRNEGLDLDGSIGPEKKEVDHFAHSDRKSLE